MRSATKQQQEAIDLYAAILEEVKVRIASIRCNGGSHRSAGATSSGILLFAA